MNNKYIKYTITYLQLQNLMMQKSYRIRLINTSRLLSHRISPLIVAPASVICYSIEKELDTRQLLIKMADKVRNADLHNIMLVLTHLCKLDIYNTEQLKEYSSQLDIIFKYIKNNIYFFYVRQDKLEDINEIMMIIREINELQIKAQQCNNAICPTSDILNE